MEVAVVVESKTKGPTIVNSNSNFVVCTYWWGNGNKNANTARPCISDYEKFVKRLKNAILLLLRSMKFDSIDKKPKAMAMLEEEYKKTKEFEVNINRFLQYFHSPNNGKQKESNTAN